MTDKQKRFLGEASKHIGEMLLAITRDSWVKAARHHRRAYYAFVEAAVFD